MAKSKKSPTPIMPPDKERYLAFVGLIQWTAAVYNQALRVSEASGKIDTWGLDSSVETRTLTTNDFHCQCHYFVIAVNKMIEFRDWSVSFGDYSGVDFSEIDRFSTQDIRDIRNMREHIKDYFTGAGLAPSRWEVQTLVFRADASSVVGNLIGGRLDWVAIGSAANRLLPKLLAEPIPYPA